MDNGYRSNRSRKGNTDSSADFAVGYLFRAMETEIDRIAMETGGEVSVSLIAGRLAELLKAKALREELGGAERMPKMRRASTQRSKLSYRKTMGFRSRDNGTLKRRIKMYARMEHRLRHSKNPKLKAQALRWFKKNMPDSVNAKKAA